MADVLTQYRAGRELGTFSPAEAEALANVLRLRCWDAYTNPKHSEHELISHDLAELMRIANPGFIGPGGEVCR
jgi:hypothetical protein